MAEVLKYIKASPSGGDEYASLKAWAAAEQANLVSAGDTHRVLCDGIDDDYGSGIAGVTLSGWTTGVSNYITIEGSSGSGFHGGVRRVDGGTGYRIKAGTNGGSLKVQQIYTRIIGIECDSHDAPNEALNINATNCLVDKVICTAIGGASYESLQLTASTSVYVRNTMVYGAGRACDARGIASTKFHNCIFVATGSATYGLLTDSNTEAKNVVCVGFATEDLYGAPGTQVSCASSDTSVAGTNPVTGVSLSDGVDFVSPSTNDYTPTATGKLADPAGVDLSADFLDDITGTAR